MERHALVRYQLLIDENGTAIFKKRIKERGGFSFLQVQVLHMFNVPPCSMVQYVLEIGVSLNVLCLYSHLDVLVHVVVPSDTSHR
jgi:hypothetical protein